MIKAYSKPLFGVCLVTAAQPASGALETLFTSEKVHKGETSSDSADVDWRCARQ